MVAALMYSGWWGAKPIADARLQVMLPTALTQQAMYSRATEVALGHGYTRYEGRGLEAMRRHSVERLPPGKAGGHRFWSETGHAIVFSWDHVPENISSFEFVFADEEWNYEDIDGFQVDDWVLFASWRDSIEQAWPGAQSSISRHPAITTRADLLLEASQASGIPLRERDMQRVAEGDPKTNVVREVLSVIWFLIKSPFS